MCLHGASWEWSQRSSRLAAGCQWTSVWQEGGEGGQKGGGKRGEEGQKGGGKSGEGGQKGGGKRGEGGRREEGKWERVGQEKMGEGK